MNDKRVEDMIEAVTKMAANLGVKIDFTCIDRRLFNKGRALTFGEVRKIAEAKSLVYGIFTDHETGERPRHGIWEAEIMPSGDLMLSQGSFGLDMEHQEFGADGDTFVNDNEYYRMELFEARPKSTEPKKKQK